MKTLCITGLLQPQLDALAATLHQSGMAPALPAQRDAQLDMGAWHRRMIESALEEAPQLHPIEHPGRMWEQLAGDIFLANLKSKVWGWADARSVWLLDFWAAFEPRLNFVLVSTSPERRLAAAIDNGEELDDVDRILAEWQHWHRQMLHFHHRHAQRCLLVDADEAQAQPQAFVERCNAQWNLALNAKVGDQGSEVDSPIALLLARELGRGHTPSSSLQGELNATLVPLTGVLAAESVKSADPVGAYRQLKDRSAEMEKLAADRELLIEELSRAKDEAASKVSAEELATAKTRLKDSEQECELLLLQLHQVQEELENYFLQHQEARQQLENATARWQRMLQRHPDYIDHAGISAHTSGDGEVRWRILNLDAAGRSFPQVEFVVSLEQQCAGYRFDAEQHPLLRWPVRALEQTLDILPVCYEDNRAERAETLFDLSTADWDLLQALNRLLRQTLAAPGTFEAPADMPLASLQAGIDLLEQIFAGLPATLRYDTVALKREQINPDYEHLWLALTNVSFAGRRWPEFEFRFSCANVRPKKFGGHPKLEFPAGAGQAPFELWFDEACDDFGAKLELRFALPEAMDGAVWGKISEHDREFVRQLVKRLPSLLLTLERDGVRLKRGLQDWMAMAEATQHILATHGV